MTDVMQEQFGKMGARVKVKPAVTSHNGYPVQVDVRRDAAGEYFELRHGDTVGMRVLEVTPSDRHLVLRARVDPGRNGRRRSRTVDLTFLCGRDERQWFVAAIPESARAQTVRAAKDALKPWAVWASINAHKVPVEQRDLRRNDAFVRQGEWFFIPRPELRVDPSQVHKREPIRRGAGKPHWCWWLYREGGESVYVSRRHPNGVTQAEFEALPPRDRRRSGWRMMTRDARVFAKGAVSHVDHKTIYLPCWHEVVLNRETEAASMRNVAFLD
jgi:hypothetical protein